jgi:hypothetical protein
MPAFASTVMSMANVGEIANSVPNAATAKKFEYPINNAF